MNKYVEIFKNCYRKFKSYVYYQNSLVYLKEKIAEFESDIELFDKSFDNLAEHFILADSQYFDNLVKQVNVLVMPKKVEEDESEKKNDVRENKSSRNPVSTYEVNFHIDGPIEIFILDVFLTMELGVASRINQYDYLYANKLHREAYNELTNEVIYNNLNIFSYYFTQYRKWKNDAIKYSEDFYKQNKDSSIISLDITGYYYHINANILEILRNNNVFINNAELEFGIKIMQKVFYEYTCFVKKFRFDISFKYCLPIGLNISCLLSNLYLTKFDKKLNSVVKHYGRYVDDIIFVIEGCKYESVSEFITDNHEIFFSSEKGICFSDFPDLCVKKDKCRIIKNYASGSADIFKKLKTEEYCVSECRLFPNFTTNVDDLLDDVFDKNEYIKFRDFDNIKIDKAKINRMIYGLILSTKGTMYKDDSRLNDFLYNFTSRISNNDIALLWAKWERLFFLYNRIDGNKKKFYEFYKLVNNCIETISFKLSFKDDVQYLDGIEQKITSIIKESMRRVLKNSYYSTLALVGVLSFHDNNEDLLLIRKFRAANLINIGAVVYPMTNYIKDFGDEIDFSTTVISAYIDKLNNGFDSFKIRYSPIFIKLEDYCFAHQLHGIVNNKNIYIKKIFEDYYNIIGINYGLKKKILKTEPINYNEGYLVEEIDLSNISSPILKINKDNVKIAVAGIDLDKLELTYKDKGDDDKIKLSTLFLSYLTKERVIRLLNESYYRDFNQNISSIIESNSFKKETNNETERTNSKEPVNFIVFPESFLPISWMHLFNTFAAETQSTIISGIRYIVYKGNAFNLVSVNIPYYDEDFHKHTLLVLRRKNVIPLYEKNILKNTKLNISNTNPNYYFVVKKDDISFAPFICYETTDIKARAMLKGNVDYIFAVEYNKDVKYFNSIGMSVSRDLFCFYVECNSSIYGSSSYGPYKNEFLPISSDKGNSRDHMHIISTDLSSLLDYKQGYDNAYLFSNQYDFIEPNKAKVDKEKSKFKKPSANTK